MSSSTRETKMEAQRDVQSDHILTPDQSEELEVLRDRFFKRARQEVITWGEEGLDLAWTYYPSLTEGDDHASPRLVVDRVHLPRVGTRSVEFIQSVAREWWPARARVSTARDDSGQDSTQPLSDSADGEMTEAVCGFYARYLNASGFTLVLEFNALHVQDPKRSPMLWRVDARSEGTQIVMPQDEGDFYDQMGAYLDLRIGWDWLIEQSQQRKALVTAEVEPGYLIGVRPGDPMSDEDPAEREDPEIEAVFSRFDIERFDTLEFINLESAEQYPFQSERFDYWLPAHSSDLLLSQQFEGFVLSQSSQFYDAIEEVAERRRIELSWGNEEDQVSIIFRRGPLWVERPFSLPYLWTLHSGRQHHEGAVDFFRDDLDRLYLASELYFAIQRNLESAYGPQGGLSIDVLDGYELVIATLDRATGHSQERVRIPLIDWAAESVFEGKEGADRFLKLWGWSADRLSWSTPQHPLDQCPLSEREARVSRVLRPKLDGESPVVIGAKMTQDIPDHLWGYYSLSCPHYNIPIFWRTTEQVRLHLKQQTHHILRVTTQVKVEVGDTEVELIWGDELAGELLSAESRESLRDRGALYAYAFTPDLLILSMLPLEETDLDELDAHAQHLISRFGPDRDWRLKWSIPLI